MSSHPKPPRSHPPARSHASIESAAAEWLARCDAGLTPETQAEFQQWLASDARHTATWEELEAAWRTFDAPRRSGAAARMIGELAVRQRRRQRRRIIGSATTVALATAAVFVFVARPFSSSPETASHAGAAQAVRVSMPERRQLADGSVVELAANAQIEVNFSATQRDVRLVRGEALFTVAKNPARPFVVAAGPAQVRAVGTAFAVGLRPTAVAVLVTEGTVAVQRTTAAAPAPLPVPSGNALVVSRSGSADAPLRLEPVTPEEIGRRLAWRAPRLELANTPLSEVVASLNRENREQLAIADPTLAALRLNGSVRADRPEDFVRVLETFYGVRAEHPAPDRVVLRRAP